jgi:hypothetical protein
MNKDSSNNSPPHGNLKRFSPTLLALAIAAPPTRDTKAMARAKPTRRVNQETEYYCQMIEFLKLNDTSILNSTKTTHSCH